MRPKKHKKKPVDTSPSASWPKNRKARRAEAAKARKVKVVDVNEPSKPLGKVLFESTPSKRRLDAAEFTELLQVNLQTAIAMTVQSALRDDDQETNDLIIQNLLLAGAPFALKGQLLRSAYCTSAGTAYDSIRARLEAMGIPVPPDDASTDDGHGPTLILGDEQGGGHRF